jgi:DnaJ family protein A protein 2
MNPEDLFSQFFGGGGGLGSMFGGGGGMQSQGPRRPRPIAHNHEVTLEQLYRGKTSRLRLKRSIVCKTCEGRGGKEGAFKTCTGCGGMGMKTMMRQMGPMTQRFQTICPDCNGAREIIREKDKCKSCKGDKFVIETKDLALKVEPGYRHDDRILQAGEGDQIPDEKPGSAIAGDVVFTLKQKEHSRFVRKDDDLYYKAEIELVTALAGGQIYVEHLDDRWLSIDIMPGEVISPGKFRFSFLII